MSTAATPAVAPEWREHDGSFYLHVPPDERAVAEVSPLPGGLWRGRVYHAGQALPTALADDPGIARDLTKEKARDLGEIQ
jgi:hypothetical protein